MRTAQAAADGAPLLAAQVSACKTWAGRGDATAGEMQAASDLDFVIEADAATGAETVTVTENKQARRQGVPAPLPTRSGCRCGRHAVLCEVIGEPIKQSAKLIREPIKGRVKTGSSQSTAWSTFA